MTPEQEYYFERAYTLEANFCWYDESGLYEVANQPLHDVPNGVPTAIIPVRSAHGGWLHLWFCREHVPQEAEANIEAWYAEPGDMANPDAVVGQWEALYAIRRKPNNLA